MQYIRCIVGLLVFIIIAFAFSNNKRAIDWRLVGVGILFQVAIAVLVLKVPFVNYAFQLLAKVVVTFLGFALNGAEFLFGDLARNSSLHNGTKHNLGFLFAFQALPSVVFFSSVTAGLYYLGVLQRVVFLFAWVMRKTMRLSGPESLSAAGNIFLGQTEAPMLVRPFIQNMSQSELHCVMTAGMATIAGSVMGTYISLLGGANVEDQVTFATYLISASIMNAPAAIVMSKLFYPETNEDALHRRLEISSDKSSVNLIDALATGASDGLKLALNIGAMLLAFIAIIYALNWFLVDGVGEATGWNKAIRHSTSGLYDGLSLQYIFGQLFRLPAFAMGVSWDESLSVGSLLGQKMIINEFVAYLDLAEMKSTGTLSGISVVISSYALCGFANFSSIAIQIGGIGGMAPGRQSDISRLGMRALLAASLATMMSATIAGALFSL